MLVADELHQLLQLAYQVKSIRPYAPRGTAGTGGCALPARSVLQVRAALTCLVGKEDLGHVAFASQRRVLVGDRVRLASAHGG